MFLHPNNNAVRGTKRALEIAEEASGPTTLNNLSDYCVDYNSHKFITKDSVLRPQDLFFKIPYDLRSFKMHQVLDNWTERLEKFPALCYPIQTIEINPVTSLMKILLNTTRGDLVEIVNTGPRNLDPTMEIYAYPPLWSDSFDPTVIDILGCHYIPNMIVSSSEHILFINNQSDQSKNVSFIDGLFNRYYSKDKLAKTIGRCRFYASKFRAIGRIHEKISRNSRRSIETGDRFTVRLF